MLEPQKTSAAVPILLSEAQLPEDPSSLSNSQASETEDLSKANLPMPEPDGDGPEENSDQNSGNNSVERKLVTGQRNWLREIATTVALFAAVWFIKANLSSEEEVEVADTTPSINNIVSPDDKLFERLTKDGDLEPTAYQFLEQGTLTYYFPIKGQELDAVLVRGIPVGEKSSNFFDKLKKNEVAVKDGSDWIDKNRMAANAEAAKFQESAYVHRLLSKMLALGAVFGVVGYVVKSMRSAVKEKMGFVIPGMKQSHGDVLTERPDEGFDHIGGIDQVIEELK